LDQSNLIMIQRKIKIETGKEYNSIMVKIDTLMKKGESNLTNKEAADLKNMALAAQAYEKSIYTISAPKTLEGMIELKMYEKKLKQKDLAKLMGLGEAKLSQILNGKRESDVAFLKAAHQKLGIDASFLLRHA
jgi:HTH-type transcriptional regulator / antitoxin HigA